MPEVARTLLHSRPASLHATNGKGNTALHEAVESENFSNPENQKAIIELLVRAGADANSINRDGRTPIELAIHRRTPELIRELTINGFVPRPQSLLCAAAQRSEAAIDLLVAAGLSINARGEQEMTALHSCLTTHSLLSIVPMVQKLIRDGIDLNALDQTGRTALQYAAANHDNSIVALLLNAGAIPNLGNWEHHITQRLSPELQTLCNTHPSVENRHLLAFMLNRYEFETFLNPHRHVIQLQYMDNDQKLFFLQCAALAGNTQFINLLLSLNVNANASNPAFDVSPLVCTVISGNEAAVELLSTRSSIAKLKEAHRFALAKGEGYKTIADLLWSKISLRSLCLEQIRVQAATG